MIGTRLEAEDLLRNLAKLKLRAWRDGDCELFKFCWRAERQLAAWLRTHPE